MQLQTVCKHCHRPFVIESENGNTLGCNCPYYGGSTMVATPQIGAPSGNATRTIATTNHVQVERSNARNQVRPVMEAKTSKGGLGKKITIIFVDFLLFVIFTPSLLCIIFPTISN